MFVQLYEGGLNMTGLDIKAKIDENNRIIESLLRPNQFILNNTIADLLRENVKLQKHCPHKFEDGFCIYCYGEEKK